MVPYRFFSRSCRLPLSVSARRWKSHYSTKKHLRLAALFSTTALMTTSLFSTLTFTRPQRLLLVRATAQVQTNFGIVEEVKPLTVMALAECYLSHNDSTQALDKAMRHVRASRSHKVPTHQLRIPTYQIETFFRRYMLMSYDISAYGRYLSDVTQQEVVLMAYEFLRDKLFTSYCDLMATQRRRMIYRERQIVRQGYDDDSEEEKGFSSGESLV